MADDISGEALQQFGEKIAEAISPTVGFFSFSHSTARFSTRTIRVLIASRVFYVALLHNTQISCTC